MAMSTGKDGMTGSDFAARMAAAREAKGSGKASKKGSSGSLAQDKTVTVAKAASKVKAGTASDSQAQAARYAREYQAESAKAGSAIGSARRPPTRGYGRRGER